MPTNNKKTTVTTSTTKKATEVNAANETVDNALAQENELLKKQMEAMQKQVLQQFGK